VQSAAGNLAQARLSLFTEAHDRMPAPFLVTLILWFAIIFTSFGLFVRHSRIAIIAIFIAGMSVSSAIGTATPDDAYAAAKLAWVADHPGHSADDYDIWGGLRATPEQQQHWLDWTAAFLAKRDDPDVLSRGLAEARAEIEQLRQQLTAKAAPAADRELHSKYFAALRETDRLRAQLAAIDKLESEQVRALRQRIAELEQRLARRDNAAGAAQTGAALDPDSAAAIEIERLKTWVQNLRRELALWKERDREAGKRGVPSFQVESLFAKALATEHEPTKQARTEAWKAYTAWKADAKKPAR
jgi:BMFP domain-containing protein YqiC